MKLKKIIAGLLVTFCVAGFVGCENTERGSSTEDAKINAETETTKITVEETPEKSVDIEQYKSMIAECSNAIEDATVILTHVGNYEYNYWSNLINFGRKNIDLNDVSEKGNQWLVENATESSDELYANVTETTMDDNFNDICQQYAEIILLNVSDSTVSSINTNFESLFNDYSTLYVTVTSPSGTVSSFSNSIVESVGNIEKELKLLASFIPDSTLGDSFD